MDPVCAAFSIRSVPHVASTQIHLLPGNSAGNPTGEARKQVQQNPKKSLFLALLLEDVFPALHDSCQSERRSRPARASTIQANIEKDLHRMQADACFLASSPAKLAFATRRCSEPILYFTQSRKPRLRGLPSEKTSTAESQEVEFLGLLLEDVFPALHDSCQSECHSQSAWNITVQANTR